MEVQIPRKPETSFELVLEKKNATDYVANFAFIVFLLFIMFSAHHF